MDEKQDQAKICNKGISTGYVGSTSDVRSKWYERLYQRKQMLEMELEQVKHAINILDTNTNVQDFATVFTQLEKNV